MLIAPTMKRAPLQCLLLLSAAALGWGCNGLPAQPNPHAPVLTRLTFEGSAVDNPNVLLFHVAFDDVDGDLSSGTLQTFINGKTATDAPMDLKEVFLRSGLSAPSSAPALTAT